MSNPGGSTHKKAIRRSELVLERRRVPLVMGVLNVTPDSFSDGGEHFDADSAIRRAVRMAGEGADIIDIGGESSRPGAEGISADEELRRVKPVIEVLREELSIPISIDTRRASVARAALDAGCRIANDITACRDPEMIDVVKHFDVPIIIMHMKGEPRSMQKNPSYGDVVKEVALFLKERAGLLEGHGIPGDKIVIDPGIGFGKRFRDNLELLRSIDHLRSLGYPVLIGASRKTFLGELLDQPAGERLSGSLAVAAWCHRTRVDIVRVHDVKETVGLFRVLDSIEHPDDYTADW
jgi:dihydropteroate synthase